MRVDISENIYTFKKKCKINNIQQVNEIRHFETTILLSHHSGLQRQRAQPGAQGRPPQSGREKLQPLEGLVVCAPGGRVA